MKLTRVLLTTAVPAATVAAGDASPATAGVENMAAAFARLSSSTPAYRLDRGCQAVATLDVYNPNHWAADGDVVGDVVPGAGNVYGNTRSTRFTLVGHSGRYTVFRAQAYFCGVMSNGATDGPSAYKWNYEVDDGSQPLYGSRSMWVRVVGRLGFNASPEPVKTAER